jgi:hypothetical protein
MSLDAMADRAYFVPDAGSRSASPSRNRADHGTNVRIPTPSVNQRTEKITP